MTRDEGSIRQIQALVAPWAEETPWIERIWLLGLTQREDRTSEVGGIALGVEAHTDQGRSHVQREHEAWCAELTRRVHGQVTLRLIDTAIPSEVSGSLGEGRFTSGRGVGPSRM